MQQFEAFKALVNTPQRVMITTHHKPDADALGSSLGLAGYLRKKGHTVTVITPSDFPNFLNWMDGSNEVMVYPDTPEASAKVVEEADLIFCLDFSSLNRINELGELVAQASAEKVLVDHHQHPQHFARFEEWDVTAAATAQLVYQLIVDLGDKDMVDAAMADALYAGIMTDTGSFKFASTSRDVHLIVADLIAAGADVAKVSKLVYDNNSLNRLKFLGFALSERLVVLPELRTAYIPISAEDLARFDSKTGDTEGIVNYALSIQGICFAAMITEREDGVKLSLRSVGDFPVNEFAGAHFNGGGHKNAAGGRSDYDFPKTVEYFRELLPKYESQLQNSSQLVKEYA